MRISVSWPMTRWALEAEANNKKNTKAEQPRKSLQELWDEGAFEKANLIGARGMAHSVLQKETMDRDTHLTLQKGQEVQRQLDSDQDGTLTKTEIESSISSYHSFMAANNGATGQTMAEKLNQMLFASEFGQKLLDNYEGISKLDGKDGISQDDIQLLAGQHGSSYRITGLDIYRASSPDLYMEYREMKSDLARVINQQTGYILA